MVFRLSQKLAKKIKVEPSLSAALSENPFLDWTAHVFSIDRSQYIIVTNTFSLFSIIYCGEGITDDNVFILRTLTLMKEYLSDDPFTFFFPRVIGPHVSRVFFSRSADKRVIGSMNDLIRNAKTLLSSEMLNPYETALKINGMPMSYLGGDSPVRAFTRLRL